METVDIPEIDRFLYYRAHVLNLFVAVRVKVNILVPLMSGMGI